MIQAMRETIVILDFGSQYSQLIARRVRECHVYSELLPHDAPWSEVESLHPQGFILSGGPASVYGQGAPQLPDHLLDSGQPLLGICYGMQLLAQELGGEVAPSSRREYGPATVEIDAPQVSLFRDQPPDLKVWMSHGDLVTRLPPGFFALAHSESSPMAAMGDPARHIYGLQFHPEVSHTPRGKEILSNFLRHDCGCQGRWTPASFIEETVAEIQAQVGTDRVVCALSGGVDSLVTACLVRQAVGDQLTCMSVNHGLLRKGEAEGNLQLFQTVGLNVHYVEAQSRFLSRLKRVIDPEAKRHIIGEEFIRLFEEESRKLGAVPFLAQGTLYPDVIESAGHGKKDAARIKTHHNVGGLPERMDFELIEPLKRLFKDEVRAVGLLLGLPEAAVYRQPFPGPGLAVRIIGEVTREDVALLQEADAIVRQEIEGAGLGRQVWQYFALLTPVKSVGVMGDGRTYESVVGVRAVVSEDAMTADWARLPHDLLARMANRIVNEVPGVNRVVYDISSKPPATIEWE
jgi:GMP synthase (glutamine-hydrolysing)